MTDEEIMSMSDEELRERSLRKRVRLFNLNADSKWSERGIGQVAIYYVEKLKGTFLLVISEEDDSLLLQSEIHQDTPYSKEQDRFIIWTEGDTVLGLSFQENAGCEDVWNTICQVQGKDPSLVQNSPDIKEEVEDTKDIVKQELFEELLDIEHRCLSAYERDVLGQLIEMVNRLVTPAIEDNVPYTSAEDRQLLDLFHMKEDIEQTEGLKQMDEIISYLSSFKRSRQWY